MTKSAAMRNRFGRACSATYVVHQRRIRVVDVPVRSFGAVQARVEDAPDHPPLLVAEQELQLVGPLIEVLVNGVNSMAEKSPAWNFSVISLQPNPRSIFFAVCAYASADVVLTEVQHPKHDVLGLARDLGRDSRAAEHKPCFAGALIFPKSTS